MDVNAVTTRYKNAMARKFLYHHLFDDAYRYVFPDRPGFTSQSEGKDHSLPIFDSTAVTHTPDLAAKLLTWAAPIEGDWMKLEPGIDFPPGSQGHAQLAPQFEALTALVFKALDGSQFYAQAYEALLDLCVSTGVLRIDDGGPLALLRVEAYPLTKIVIEPGPWDSIKAVYSTVTMTAETLFEQWPEAQLPASLRPRLGEAGNNVEVVEATIRDYAAKGTETHDHIIFLPEFKVELQRARLEGQGSSPWIVFRWAKPSGEIYGRGPVLNILPDIRTVNAVVEMTLENAEMAIAGIWQADDDGVVNPGTIQLVPGAIIPRAVGSTGLEPLTSPGRFDVASLILEDLRTSIRRGLFVEDTRPEGARTPPTATEVLRHEVGQMSRLAPALARFGAEFYTAVMVRVLHIFKGRGILDQAPLVNQRQALVRPTSPMATARHLETLERSTQWLDIVGGRSAEAIILTANMERFSNYVARVLGVPHELLQSRAERADIKNNAIALLQQAAQIEGVPA